MSFIKESKECRSKCFNTVVRKLTAGVLEEVFGRWGGAIAEVSDEERPAGPEPPLWTPKLVSYFLSVGLVGYSSTTQILRPEGDEGD